LTPFRFAYEWKQTPTTGIPSIKNMVAFKLPALGTSGIYDLAAVE